MPYASVTKQRAANRAAQMRRRARLRAQRKTASAAAVPPPGKWPKDPAAAVARWSRRVLVTPAGHPRAGKPLTLPPYCVSFLRDALAHRESLLCIGRKNAKSCAIAVLLLAHLVGPLRRAGWRAGVGSISKEKAAELVTQMREIAEASGLAGLTFYRSPAPGRVVGPSGSVDILAADRGAGHSSGFDVAVVDEIGLLAERDRAFVAGLRSSISARDGRFVSLSIHRDGPFVPEILKRKGDPGLAIHHYAAPDGCALDDEDGWAAANPGIAAGIKSLAYMRDEARRVLASPADQNHFRAHELNQAVEVSREVVVNVTDWKACTVADRAALPPRRGAACIGYDLGGSTSMTTAVAIWRATGRMETWAAFPAVPTLHDRGMADAVGDLYVQMAQRGELRTYPGRVTDVAAFLRDVARDVGAVRATGADRYRRAEALQALEDAGVRWRMQWRGTGASATADGSHDVRAFQRMVIGRKVRAVESLLMAAALKEATIRTDAGGNPALDKQRSHGRIDVVQAAVIAASLAETMPAPRRARLHLVGAT